MSLPVNVNSWQAGVLGNALLGAGCSNIGPMLHSATGRQTAMLERTVPPRHLDCRLRRHPHWLLIDRTKRDFREEAELSHSALRKSELRGEALSDEVGDFHQVSAFELISRMREASASMAKGLVNTSIPGSRWPLPNRLKDAGYEVWRRRTAPRHSRC